MKTTTRARKQWEFVALMAREAPRMLDRAGAAGKLRAARAIEKAAEAAAERQ